MAFRSALLLLAAALALTACVSAPPLAADPDTAAYLAQGTLQFRANRLVRLIKDNYPALEASRKTVSGQVYVYFRLKPQR